MLSNNKTYLPELDGLRAFAVSIVIINHFNKELLPSGFLGVDIFFLISGFVITSSLCNRSENNFWVFISNFYSRRIKRIFPALITCVLFSSIFICFFNDSPKYEIKSAITSVFGLSNFYFIKISMDYFSQTAEINPFLHTWSLGVEEQFYFVFPLIFWNSGFSSNQILSYKKFIKRIGILSLVSLIGFAFLYHKYQTFTYFFMPTRFWEIASGSLLFLFLKEKPYFLKGLQKIPSISILFLMFLITLLPLDYFVFSVFAIIILTCTFIVSLNKGSLIYNFFTNKTVVSIGLISYSLYLWHWPIIALSRLTIGIQWWTIPIQLILIILFAVISYRFIENPIRNNKTIFFKKKNIFIAAASSLALSSLWLSYLFKFNQSVYIGNKKLIQERTVFKIKINEKVINDAECNGKDVIRGERPQCIVKPINKSNPTMFLLGDSHVQHYLPLFEEIRKTKDYGYEFYGRGGIPIGRRIEIKNKKFKDETISKNIVNHVINKISENDIVIISERHERNFAPKMLDGKNDKPFFLFFENNNEISRIEAINRYGEYLKTLFREIDQKNASLIIFQPTHSFKGITLPPNVCRQWFASLNPGCEKGLTINREKALNNLLEVRKMHSRIAEETNQGIKIFDAFSILCPSNQSDCSQILDKKPLFMDNDHLSEEGALIMKNKFFKLLDEL